MILKPRPYQTFAKNELFRYFRSGVGGNPVLAYPTGTGKSLIIADFIAEVTSNNIGVKSLILTDVQELVEQNYKKLKQYWPQAPAGIYSAGLGIKQHYYPITFASIQSVWDKHALFGKVDIMVIDEAHMLSLKESSMYQKLITSLKTINPHLVVIGLTATAYRMGQGKLTDPIEKDGEVVQPLFTDILVDATSMKAFNWFIHEGYLCRVVGKNTDNQIDVSGVKLIGGEFNQKQLEAVSDQDKLNIAICEEIIERAFEADRRSWLTFCSGIKHVEHISDLMNDMGVKTTFVHSKIPKNERRDRIEGFKAGEYTQIVNNGILTKGFDHPEIDLINDLQATNSVPKHVQKIGRGTRPVYAEGFDLDSADDRLLAISQSHKTYTLYLDFAGNVKRLGPINDPQVPKPKKKRSGDAPVKECPQCKTLCHASLTQCDGVSPDGEECGYEFPRALKLNATASQADVVREDVKPIVERFKVNHVAYNLHLKDGRPPSIMVSYHCEKYQLFREWVCLQHPGSAGHKSKAWWKERQTDTSVPIPSSTVDALGLVQTLKEPQYIEVWVNKNPNGKNPEIKNYVF